MGDEYKNLLERWKRFRTKSFPGFNTEDDRIADLIADSIEIDGTLAGIIIDFFDKSGKVNVEQEKIMLRCIHELEDNIKEIAEPTKSHFKEILLISKKIIEYNHN